MDSRTGCIFGKYCVWLWLCQCVCVWQRGTEQEKKKRRLGQDKNNDRTCIFRGEKVSVSTSEKLAAKYGKKKTLIHHCRVRQRNSTLLTVQSRHVWMCKSLSFAVSLCQRWLTAALRGIAARCLGESHNSSMYCRINGALIWLAGHVCEREGVCLCVCVLPCIHLGVSEIKRERKSEGKSGAITDRT